mmetsp:Transcript_19983/g.43195  ORF Transcript_19983/g.43195 Transcript_19983/m.43195 type:complete len:152 (-) Transcript_19983:46-501(-)
MRTVEGLKTARGAAWWVPALTLMPVRCIPTGAVPMAVRQAVPVRVVCLEATGCRRSERGSRTSGREKEARGRMEEVEDCVEEAATWQRVARSRSGRQQKQHARATLWGKQGHAPPPPRPHRLHPPSGNRHTPEPRPPPRRRDHALRSTPCP